MQPFRLAHVSDPHLPPPAGAFGWGDIASKRLLSALAWRRKGREHQPRVLDALMADVRAYGPDHIAITGDLTNFASPVELDAAKSWLQTLGPAAEVTVSPGNHDALVGRRGWDRFEPWRDWLGDEPEVAFPQVRLRAGVALINLCSATPTQPHLASGRLGRRQLDRLDEMLADLSRQDVFRVLMIHHPPVAGVVSRRKALEDGADLRQRLETHGVDLVLHGHAHEAAVSTLRGPQGAIPVLGTPSASAAGHGRHPSARWHAIEVAPATGGATIRIRARGLSRDTGAFEDLGSYVLAPPQRG